MNDPRSRFLVVEQQPLLIAVAVRLVLIREVSYVYY